MGAFANPQQVLPSPYVSSKHLIVFSGALAAASPASLPPCLCEHDFCCWALGLGSGTPTALDRGGEVKQQRVWMCRAEAWRVWEHANRGRPSWVRSGLGRGRQDFIML